MMISRFWSHSSKLHRTYFHGVYHICKTFPVKKKNQQTKWLKCLEMSFRPIQSQQDRTTWVCCSHRSHFGIRVALCASTNLFLPTFCDNLFNMPYSISASLQEKLSLNGDFLYRLLIIVERYQTCFYFSSPEMVLHLLMYGNTFTCLLWAMSSYT